MFCFCAQKLKDYKGYCINREECAHFVCALSTSILFTSDLHMLSLVGVSFSFRVVVVPTFFFLFSWCLKVNIHFSFHAFLIPCTTNSIGQKCICSTCTWIHRSATGLFSSWNTFIEQFLNTWKIKSVQLSPKNTTIVLYERILNEINSTLTWNKCLLCVTFPCVSPCKLDPIHNTHMCTYVCIRDRLEVVCCVYISRFFTYGLIRLRTPWRTICRTQSLSSISHAHENGHDYSVYRYTYREDPCVHQTKSNKEHLLLLFCCVVY